MQYFIMFLMTILQNASFTLVSRARNSDSIMFHALAAICSNGIWVLVIRKLVINLDNWGMIGTYVIGTVIGSIVMHYVSMKWIEPYFKRKKNGKLNSTNNTESTQKSHL